MITGGMWIYFFKPVGMAGPVKIGCSRKPGNRLAYLARWSPFPLECVGSVVGDIVFERAIHRKFAHLHGHEEWFQASPELMAFIRKALGVSRIDHAFALVQGKVTPIANDLAGYVEEATS